MEDNTRDNIWLRSRLDSMLENHFDDIEHLHPILIHFGRRSKTRLGSITLRHRERIRTPMYRHEVKSLNIHDAVSLITINSLLKHEQVPEVVVDGVIAHELVHYCHGFNSLLPRKHKHPHAGGVVRLELKKRGIDHLERDQKKWTKVYWREFMRKLG